MKCRKPLHRILYSVLRTPSFIIFLYYVFKNLFTVELKPLKLIKKENGYKIKQYVKTIDLVRLEEPSKSKKLKHFFYKLTNPIYYQLSDKEKRILHTISPIWANILENNLGGSMIVTDDNGNRYDLDSMSSTHCLVGEVYGFPEYGGYGSCGECRHYNIHFAGLNNPHLRNSSFLSIRGDLKEFLNHYYVAHLLPEIENSHGL